MTTRHSGRETLQQDVGAANLLQWVKQVHGSKVFSPALGFITNQPPEADAQYTRLPNMACGVLTADCLPVFFCDQFGEEVAVAHAGWRGLAAGVLENTLVCFKAKPEQIMAWLGPAIGPCHFEVGEEVREAFISVADSSIKERIGAAFSPSETETGKWMADLFELARVRLAWAGVEQIYGGGLCTFCNDDTFFSYRKNKNTGRFASVIWRE